MKFIEVTNSTGDINLVNIDHIVRIYSASDNVVLVLSSVDSEGKNDSIQTSIKFEEAKKMLGAFVIDPKPTGKTVGFTRKE